jgi:WXG100 protein secretion system (Wss), protein YukD
MGMVLVTVVRGDQRRDLAVRSDVPIGDLLGPLADALADDLEDDRGERRREPRAPSLALAPVCRARLPVERPLEACGVGHGAVLVLLDAPAGAAPVDPPADHAARPG